MQGKRTTEPHFLRREILSREAVKNTVRMICVLEELSHEKQLTVRNHRLELYLRLRLEELVARSARIGVLQLKCEERV